MAPGGHGKSALLRELAEVYRESGVDVVTDWPASSPADWGRAVMLVDNAHLLPGAQLRVLRELGCRRLIVACRPWPRPPELCELLQTADPVQLSTWDVMDVRRVLAGAGIPECHAEEVHDLTGGVPRWVLRIVRAWGDAPTEAVRFDLESLDMDLQCYLIAVQAGVGRRLDLLGGLLGRDSDGVGDMMRAARASGFFGPDGTLLPLCARAVVRVIPAEQYLAVLERLAELLLDRPEPILPFARTLLGSGVTGSTVASVLERAGHEVLGEDPGLAAELFGAAVSAGRPLADVITDWARAAALAGDLDTALRLADQAILRQDVEGARVAGAAMAHRGQWARSAELYGWAGDTALAQVASIAVGSMTSVPVVRGGGPPTALEGAAALMAEGVRTSITGSPVEALSTLVRAAALLEPTGRDALLPDSPAALAAIVALHAGEFDVAESVLAGQAGGKVLRTRHALLRAWVHLVRGRLGLVAEAIEGMTTAEPRDRIFLVGLEVGLARRAGDTLTLRRVWTQAAECLMRHPVDLFTFLPLGEFVVAAARLRDPGRIAGAVQDAFGLLKRLGNPVLWAIPLHWAGVQAAVLAERPAEGHVRGLAANRMSYGVALTEAARCWADLIQSEVDPHRVHAAAVGLPAAGLWWDGARLASEAAIRTADRKAMVGLLDCARQLQARPLATQPAISPLSGREQEVADLVLQGMTYKQIADKLFISAKTVEHHMARIRNRLGASNRSEVISRLRGFGRA